MKEGSVKWFDAAKGYGFLTPDEGGREVFVHYRDIAGIGYRTLTDGQRVGYDQVDGPKGPKAENVIPL
jgi:cold shock protein